jgi:hypothetical protein
MGELFVGIIAFLLIYISPIALGIKIIFRSKEEVFDGQPSKEQDD